MQSSTLAAVGYDEATSRLFIEFRQGGTYVYFAVPPSTYRLLVTARSAGSFFSTSIRSVFPFEHLSD